MPSPGFVRTAAGTVRMEGADITGFDPRRVAARGIARTFQRSRLLLDLSVFDNLMLGKHRGLDHGPWFNLLRAQSLCGARSSGRRSAHARCSRPSVRSCLRGCSSPRGALTMIDRRRVEICRALISEPTPAAARRAFRRHDARRDRAS